MVIGREKGFFSFMSGRRFLSRYFQPEAFRMRVTELFDTFASVLGSLCNFSDVFLIVLSKCGFFSVTRMLHHSFFDGRNDFSSFDCSACVRSLVCCNISLGGSLDESIFDVMAILESHVVEAAWK